MRQTTAIVLLLTLLLPSRLAAHQQLISAAPAAEASLTRAPEAIRLTFNEAVEEALARVRLVGPAGDVMLAPLEIPADSPRVVVAGIEGPLTPGTYTVHWLVTSADGHPVRGEYSFVIEPGAVGLTIAPPTETGAVDPGAPTPGQEPPPADDLVGDEDAFDSGSPLYAAVRWLTFAGLLAAIGASGFALLLLPALRRRDASVSPATSSVLRTRAAGVGLAAGGVLVVALALRLAAQSAALHGTGELVTGELTGTLLTRTLWGWGWILQAVATAALLLGLWLARSGRAGGWAIAAPATLALAVTPALSGHAAATSTAAIVADSLHVLAAGGWLGTLLLVLAVGVPALARTDGSRAAAVSSLLTAFTPLALGFAGLLTLTGVYSAWAHLPELSALWTSAYGRTLLLKLAVLSGVFGTGAYNWLRVQPALATHGDPRPLRRSAAVELALGTIVLAVTAALVATPPPADDRAAMPGTSMELTDPGATAATRHAAAHVPPPSGGT